MRMHAPLRPLAAVALAAIVAACAPVTPPPPQQPVPPPTLIHKLLRTHKLPLPFLITAVCRRYPT